MITSNEVLLSVWDPCNPPYKGRVRLRVYGEKLSPVKESPSYPSYSGEPTFPKFPYKTWRTVYMRSNFYFPLSWTWHERKMQKMSPMRVWIAEVYLAAFLLQLFGDKMHRWTRIVHLSQRCLCRPLTYAMQWSINLQSGVFRTFYLSKYTTFAMNPLQNVQTLEAFKDILHAIVSAARQKLMAAGNAI